MYHVAELHSVVHDVRVHGYWLCYALAAFQAWYKVLVFEGKSVVSEEIIMSDEKV